MKLFSNLKNTFLTAGSFAVTHIPNCCMVKILSLFTLARVPRKRTNDNLAANQKILAASSAEGSGFFFPGQFIENQSQWEDVHFGLSTMRYSGCEIMAVYNTLLALGNRMTARELAGLISHFERKGAELSGRWGCSPRSIYKYFVSRGYKAVMTTSTKPAVINSIGANNDSIIITAYNDRNDIRRMIHTVSITKSSSGNFILHNAYKRINGKYAAYCGSHPVTNLWDVIGFISQEQAAPICIIGINRQSQYTNIPSDFQ